MKTLFNNKILIILLFFVILSCCITTSCFASDFEFSFTDNEGNSYNFTCPVDFSSYQYFVLGKSTDGQYVVYYSNSELKFSASGTVLVPSDGVYPVSGYYGTPAGSTYLNGSTSISEKTVNCFLHNSGVLYSNYDVYDVSGNLVFQGAPQEEQEQEEVQTVELMKIQQVAELPQKMAEIVKIVLPVCLIVFGTLLVLYLIKSKNLLQL